jgi:hypothetical protein
VLNAKLLLPILQRSLPKASPSQLLLAIKKFEQANPNINEAQFLAAMQQYMRQIPQPPFQGLMNNLPTGAR